MTVEKTVTFEVKDITGIVLECKSCQHALTVRQESAREFIIRESQKCPVCGKD